MKNNIDKIIEKIKSQNCVGIMAHMVTSYPTLVFSKKLAKTLVKSGVDIIEIQIPFSDPMADGPLIVEACEESLKNGTQLKDSFELAKFISNNLKKPVVLMTYANILVHMGIKNFCDSCEQNGVSGIIVPDLPYDSAECIELQSYAVKKGIHLIYVISPAIEKQRLQAIHKLATGFLYCTSRQGTTGTGKKFIQNINSYLSRVKNGSRVPLAVGFGISSSKDFKLIKKYSEIGVIGSALINIIRKNKSSKILPAISKFIYGIKN